LQIAFGWLTAIDHYLLYMGFISETLQPCGQGLSCAEINLEFLGFTTIPMLSQVMFSILVFVLLVLCKRIGK